MFGTYADMRRMYVVYTHVYTQYIKHIQDVQNTYIASHVTPMFGDMHQIRAEYTQYIRMYICSISSISSMS